MLARTLALAMIGSQGTEFAQHYRQRAGAALDELRRIVAEFDAEPASERLRRRRPSNGSRPKAIPSPAGAARTWRERSYAPAGFRRSSRRWPPPAGPFRRLDVMVEDFDPQIARRTLDDYEPSAPLSFEAVTAAGVAAVFGWVAVQLCV